MLAYTFHWAPEALMALTADDLDFWGARLQDIDRALKQERQG